MFGEQRTGPDTAFLVESPAHSINAFQPSDIASETLIHSQNHRVVWTGREIKAHPVPDPWHGQLFLSPSEEHQEKRLLPLGKGQRLTSLQTRPRSFGNQLLFRV